MDESNRPRGERRVPALEFRAFFDVTYGPATSYLRRRLVTGRSYEDAAADAFTVAWRRWDDRPVDEGEWVPWMYGICRNVLRNHERSDRRRRRLLRRISAEPAPVEVRGTDLHAELHDALASLTDLDQEVVRLTYWEGLSREEVAIALGCSVNAVAVRTHRARRRVAALLDDRRVTPAGMPDIKAVNPTLPTEHDLQENPA